MNVRLLEDVFGEPTIVEIPREQFAEQVRQGCQSQMDRGNNPLSGYCSLPASACEERMCEADIRLCVANQLLSYTRIVAPEEIDFFTGGDPETRTIPPQSPATNAGLAQLAGAEAQWASVYAVVGLWQHRIDTGGTCLPDELTIPDDDPISGQVYTANILAEAYQLATGEAHETMGEFTAAVADAYFSDEAQLRDATELAHVAPLLSRAWYAHFVMGGSPGLPAV